MKKYFLLPIAAMFFNFYQTKAQISIQYADLPSVGNAYATAIDSTSNFLDSLTIDSASADSQYWNYSLLSPTYIDTSAYFDPALTPNFSYFPQAQMSTYIEETKTYTYLKKDSTGLYGIGVSIDLEGLFGFGVLNFPATSNELILGVPASYNSTFTNNAWYEALIGSGTFGDTIVVREVNKTMNVDAWGTVVTPFDTANVIRLYEYSKESIKLYFRDFIGTLWPIFTISSDTSNIYRFLTDEYKHPVLTINTDKDKKVRYIEYLYSDSILPKADFYADTTLAFVNTGIDFINNSTGSTSWQWDLGDSTTSNVHQPRHSYTATGQYSVKLVAYNNNGVDSITKVNYITVTEPLIVKFGYRDTGLNVTFSDSSLNYPEFWYWDFGDAKISDIKNPTHLYALPDTYVVKLTVSNSLNSSSFTDTIIVNFGTGINEYHVSNSILVYPNPCTETIKFSFLKDFNNISEIKIYDHLGQLIKIIPLDNLHLSDSVTKLDLNKLSNGLYFYKVIDNKGVSMNSGKFIVAKSN